MTTSREVRLKSRPVGMPTAANFEVASVDLPDPGPGQKILESAGTWRALAALNDA